TPEIPITAVAREDIEYSIMRKVWKIGHSEEGPMRTMERSIGSARLTERGQNGHPQLVPEYARKALVSSAPKAAPRPGPTKALAQPHHADRQSQLIRDRQHHTTPRRAVELGHGEARHRHGPSEFARLLEGVLPQGGIEHEQHVMRGPRHQPAAHPRHLLELRH